MADKSVYIRRRIALVIILLFVIGSIAYAARRGFLYYQNYLKYSKITMSQGEIKQGQVLFDSLLENHISREVANEVVSSIGGILNLRSLRVGEKYKVYKDENGQIVKFVYQKSPIDECFLVRTDEGQFCAFKPVIFLEKEILTRELTIESSLFEATLKAGETEMLVFNFVDVFAWDIDFFSYPRVGDTINIYFEKYYKDEQFVKYGRILAAQYKGRDTFNAIYFEPKKDRSGYFAFDGKPIEKMFLKTPLKFTGRITSYFGVRRDPFTSRHGSHSGVDFAAYYGAPIVASSDGRVSFTGWKGAYGKLVIVKHSNGYSTYYGHCSRILVKPGQKVTQGQFVAKVGSTGRSTGPHCHYEIRSRGQAFNPLRFNQPKRKALAGKDLEDFKIYSKKVWENIESVL